ncbi:MAG: alpha/beta hydrolase [Pseudomonadota bacterium]
MATMKNDKDFAINPNQSAGLSEAAARFEGLDTHAPALLTQLAQTVSFLAHDSAARLVALQKLETIASDQDRKRNEKSSVPTMMAILDQDFVVKDANTAAQNYFHLAPGVNVSERMIEPDKAKKSLSSPGTITLVNFATMAGKHYPAAIRRLDDENDEPRYRLALHRLQLSDSVKAALKSHYRLSASEMSVIEGIIDRRTAHEIAEARDVQKSTVTSQIHNIVKKLSSDSITDATLQIASLINADEDDLPEPVAHPLLVSGEKTLEIKSPAGSIHYRKMGETGGAPVIFLHGLFDAAPPPEKFTRELVRRGFCPFFVYRPGFAQSSFQATDEQIVAALDGFIQKITTSPAILVGMHEAAPLTERLVIDRAAPGAKGRRAGGVRGSVVVTVADWTVELASAANELGIEKMAHLIERGCAEKHHESALIKALFDLSGDDKSDRDIARAALENLPDSKTVIQDLARGMALRHAPETHDNTSTSGAGPDEDVGTPTPAMSETEHAPNQNGAQAMTYLAPIARRLDIYADPSLLIGALEKINRP